MGEVLWWGRKAWGRSGFRGVEGLAAGLGFQARAYGKGILLGKGGGFGGEGPKAVYNFDLTGEEKFH